MRDPEDPEALCNTPPIFKVGNPDPEAIESNYEWEGEPIDAGEALTRAADYLGPLTSADVLARHWFNTERSGDILEMAEHLQILHRRLTRTYR